MSEENKPNYEEAIKRTYYVLWVVWCLYIYWDGSKRGVDDMFTNMVTAIIAPLFPYIAAKWIYSGYKKLK